MKNSSFDSGAAAARAEPFVYRDWALEGGDDTPGAGGEAEPEAGSAFGIGEDRIREREQAVRAQAWREAREQLLPEAYQQAEQALQAGFEQRLEQERATIAATLQAFAEQRERYFAQIERELIQLVLAVARKVLHRESNLDPLLLAAVVRVALDPLAAGSAVELVVPPSKLPLWEAELRRPPALAAPPRLRADRALEPCGCRIETDNGSTDLGWEAQLREIEQGFCDLLKRRTALTVVRAGAAE